jgi:two-component system, OmpR family, phosphate regulon sensor histidine kinase PhoR
MVLDTSRSEDFYLQQEFSNLQRLLRVLSHEMIERLNAGTATKESLCQAYARNADVRVTIIDLDGVVIADSHENPNVMDNHKNRPELISAKEHGEGVSSRMSPTLGVRMIYAGQRFDLNRESFLLRVSMPLRDLEEEFKASFVNHIITALFVMILMSISVWWLCRRIAAPLESITKKVYQISRGLQEENIEPQGSLELQQLTHAINLMHQHSKERIATIIQQRNQQEAMLMGMKEGVISFDGEGYIQTINPMARHMLRCAPHLELQGRGLGDILRSSTLLDALEQLRMDGKDIDLEVVIEHLNETVVQVRGCRIESANTHENTYLVVLNDITHLRRLENMRRDFVANVSHELKTPLTSIRGYAETLANMKAFNDETALRFLNKIEHNADRLHNIIEDLLILSRIEQSGLPPQDIKAQHPKTIIDQLVAELPEDQRQRVNVKKISTLKKVLVHGPLFHQALYNLMENGLKYSGANGIVELTVLEQGSWISFQVSDNGPGIPAQHIPMLTQRFYRVDKDRSRSTGGTGLGLSIVKHIVEAHHGEFLIKSTVGEGSCFSIRLPIGDDSHILTKT